MNVLHLNRLQIKVVFFQFNVSHKIFQLSFGRDYPGIVNPLDATEWISEKSKLALPYSCFVQLHSLLTSEQPGCRRPHFLDVGHVTRDACWEATPTHASVNIMTDTSKNITLPQTLLRAVITGEHNNFEVLQDLKKGGAF